MLNMRNKIWIFLFLFALVVIPFSTQAQTPQQTLKQYISNLQKNPNDNALREKIIKHVRTMKPAPVISEEARRHFVRGNTALKDAKDSTDYDRAIARYNDALLISPWWAEPYFNMAKALELRERYEEAISALKLYLLAAPKVGDTRSAQDMIYVFEDKKEKSSPAAQEVRRKKEFESWLKKLDGGRWDGDGFYGINWRTGCNDAFIEIRGDLLLVNVFVKRLGPGIDCHLNAYIGEWEGEDKTVYNATVTGRESPLIYRAMKQQFARERAVISEDGQSITLYLEGGRHHVIYRRTR